jgi:hypothetical protein
MEDSLWEGASSHPNTRVWPAKEPGGDELTRGMDVGRLLFYAGRKVRIWEASERALGG